MSKKKVLVVDDDEMIRLLVSTTIEDERYELYQASNGSEALDVIRRVHPNIVLLDVSMPRMSGFDVCRAVKSDPETSDTVVVMLTAHGHDADRSLGEEVGADRYFTKPFSPLELLMTLREVLGE